MAANSSE